MTWLKGWSSRIVVPMMATVQQNQWKFTCKITSGVKARVITSYRKLCIKLHYLSISQSSSMLVKEAPKWDSLRLRNPGWEGLNVAIPTGGFRVIPSEIILLVMQYYISASSTWVSVLSIDSTWHYHHSIPRYIIIWLRDSHWHCTVLSGKLWYLQQNCVRDTIVYWRHNELDYVSNHLHHNCLLNHLFRRRSKKISKLCVTGLF